MVSVNLELVCLLARDLECVIFQLRHSSIDYMRSPSIFKGHKLQQLKWAKGEREGERQRDALLIGLVIKGLQRA